MFVVCVVVVAMTQCRYPVIHRQHPLYLLEAVCGETHPVFAGAPTCLACSTWRPAPLRPSGKPDAAWEHLSARIQAGDCFEVVGLNARMVAVEDIDIIAVERYGYVLYAVDSLDRRWPMDLPAGAGA